MATYDYILQGVPLTDRRWPVGNGFEGAWFLNPGTSVLPKFPGLRATRFQRPGQHGESQAQFAPLQPKTEEFSIRFLAVCTDPTHPRFRQEGATFDERMAFLEHNITDFMFRTRIGATSTGGYLELKRVNNEYEHFAGLGAGNHTGGEQTTAGRFISSSEAEMDQDARWADYTLLFEVPTGTWWTKQVRRRVDVPSANSTVTVDLPMGTAPVWDSQIAVRQNGDRLEAGSTFLNDMDVGFRVSYWTSSWWVMDVESRMSGNAGTGTSPNWNRSKDNARLIHEVGRPLGSALVINPGAPGSGERIGRVKVRLTSPGTVWFSYNPRFF